MPARLGVTGEGDCPAAVAVARALERLHPGVRADAADGVAVQVGDRGDRYVVRAGGGTRLLEDPGRRCGERATAAALAVTLLLDPPATPAAPEEPAGPLATRESPPAPPPPPQQPPQPQPPQPQPPTTTPTPTPTSSSPTPTPTTSSSPTPTPTRPSTPPPVTPAPGASPRAVPSPTTLTRAAAAPPARRPSRIDLELTGVLGGAPTLGSAAAELTGGAALRLALGGRHVAGTIGFAGLAPATATSSSVAVRVVRVPFDAGLRLALPVGRVEPGLDVGLAFAVLQLSAPALPDTRTSTRLDVGARLAPFLRIGLTARLALVFGLEMIVSFAPYDLVVDPGATKIATTPRLWLGGGLGLAARL